MVARKKYPSHNSPLTCLVGAGKSVLMYSLEISSYLTERSSIVKTLRTELRSRPTTGFAFYYCLNDSTTSCIDIIGSLIKTLVLRSRSRNEAFHRKLDDMLEEMEFTFSSYQELFEWVSQYYDEIFLVVDAVDECEDWETLLKCLTEFMAKRKVKVLISSRPGLDMMSADNILRGPILSIDPAVKSEIETHLKYVFETHPRLSRFSVDFKNMVFHNLSKLHGGMSVVKLNSIDVLGFAWFNFTSSVLGICGKNAQSRNPWQIFHPSSPAHMI